MKLKPLQIAALILVAALILLRVLSKPAPAHPYYTTASDRPLVIAHQGGDGVWPGESMLAYQNSVELGVDVLEMDIHITQNGELVLMHDAVSYTHLDVYKKQAQMVTLPNPLISMILPQKSLN